MGRNNKNKQPDCFILRPLEKDEVLPFSKALNGPSRPENYLFSRTSDALYRAQSNRCLLGLFDKEEKLNTVAALYDFSVEADIGSSIPTSGEPYRESRKMTFAEIGTVWRLASAPTGFCLDLMYSACTLQAYLKANDLLISSLVTQVVAENKIGIEKLEGINQGWNRYLPCREFSIQFQKTIPDQKSRDTELVSFCAPTNVSILEASRCLLGENKHPKFSSVPNSASAIQAYDKSSKSPVRISLKKTELLSTAREIVQLNRKTPLSSLIKRNASWFEARMEIEKAIKALPLVSTKKMPVGKKAPSSAIYA